MNVLLPVVLSASAADMVAMPPEKRAGVSRGLPTSPSVISVEDWSHRRLRVLVVTFRKFLGVDLKKKKPGPHKAAV